MLVKVVTAQLPIGEDLSLADKIHIFKRKPDFVCLPEYFFMPPGARDYSLYASSLHINQKKLERLSRELDTTLIGGTLVERNSDGFYNTAYVFSRGRQMATYRKKYPTEGEKSRGIIPGRKLISFEINGLKVGILICADVLHRESFELLAGMDVDLVFIPTVSPLRADDSLSDKNLRDEKIFLEGSRTANAFMIKTCGLGTLFGKPLNGRSLIASPWGILWKISPDNEQHPHILSHILDIDELHEFRRKAMINELVGKIKPFS
ncbi:MAG: hypothetical protein GF404_09680 [candidate division Zixibacteria bacterium]|nr:hypothetical protein [candidate division Zixibacteria bacterium]